MIEVAVLLLILIAILTKVKMTLDDLLLKVSAEATAVQSAVVLLQGLKAKLDAAGLDPVKLQALGDAIDKQTADLAAAVAANTPA